jgi:hypothetical protein
MDGCWQPFSPSDSELLSIIFENGLSKTTLYLGGGNTAYVVDTTRNCQINILTKFCRQIQNQFNPAYSKSSISSVVSAVDNLINAAQQMTDPEDDSCAICLDPFDSEFGDAFRLPLCDGHGFHKECIRGAIQASGKCPLCMKMYLIQEGLQPSSGSMSSVILPPGKKPLEGYPGVGTIIM